MDLKQMLTNQASFLNGQQTTNDEFRTSQKTHLLSVVSSLEWKVNCMDDLKQYYLDEFDFIIKRVLVLGRQLNKHVYFINELLYPLKCLDSPPTINTWKEHYILLDEICTKLAHHISINSKELEKFRQPLFNLMALYTQISTSLYELPRFDRETLAQINVLKDDTLTVFTQHDTRNKI